MNLKTPIKDAGQLYKTYASRLDKLGITKIEDFLYHIPFRYEDYSVISKTRYVRAGETVTIIGTIADIENGFTKSYKKIQKAVIADETGQINVIWFNQPFILKTLRKDDKISLSGKVTFYLNKPTLESPEYEILNPNTEPIHTGRLVPVYPETQGVSSKWLRRQVYKILKEHKQNMFEYIPDSILENENLIGFSDAIEQIHFPKEHKNATSARLRLGFDELFLMQMAALQRRSKWEKDLIGNTFKISEFEKKIQEFWERLPFELTNAQKKSVNDIFSDLKSKKPMNRLLEGDVGSGKTVVAAISMYLAFLNGYQSVLMAPTEILAQQHYKTIFNLLSPLKVKIELITGGSKRGKIQNTKYPIHSNDILIGTHALLGDKIKLNKLGLVVIDEQQRFGVEQRAIIKQKGENPHLLTMTATPIPRTIALTMYGDLDLSYLDEMPKGRKIVKTWLVPPEKRNAGYEWIKKEIKKHDSQVFIICPFIEQSESMQTVKAASQEFENLRKKVFSDFRLGLLHGKLKSKEKDEVLQKFKNKEFDILVATPVVEVGIDIPNATIIVIEGSERFGLAGLHQLRGRVGRGNKQSYCLLFAESRSPKAYQRLKGMERMQNGAELAEYDLKLRGPGEMYGTAQHGLPNLKIASFSDFALIENARKQAQVIFKELKNHPKLIEKLEEVNIKQVSPD